MAYYLYEDCYCVNNSAGNTMIPPICTDCENRRITLVQEYTFTEGIKNSVKSEIRYDLESKSSNIRQAFNSSFEEEIDKIDWNAKVKEGLLALIQNDQELSNLLKEGLD